MDFALSFEQKSLAESVARFCERDYTFDTRRERLNSDSDDRTLWAAMADLGWIGAGLSEAEGGFGGGPVDNTIIMEGFGRALMLEPFLSTAIFSLQALAHAPSGDLRDSSIADIVAGKLQVALAHGEPSSHGAADHVEATAKLSGGKWRLSGHKSLVLGAPSANLVLVTARADSGIGLFVVAAGAPNLRVQAYRTLDGASVGDMWFDNVAAECVAPPGAGLQPVLHALEHALVGICAEAVGAMDAAITTTRDYIKLRRQFGSALSEFQAVQHRMADMLVELELSRSMLYQGVAGLNWPDAERARAMSAMKAVVSSAAMFVGRNAVQLHGAIGMTEDCAIGHYYRRLFVIAHLFGNETAHLDRLARSPIRFWPTVPNLT